MALASPVRSPTKKKAQTVRNEQNFESSILESLTSGYTELDSADLLGKTLEYLRENIKPGICLVCIENVENNEAIWSCDQCYCILHLVCVQRWAKDSIANVKEAAAYKGFNIPIVWCCPKCRGENTETEFPSKYKCFCGKVVNPVSNGWSAPHSCGETCGKPLKPECGHSCVLLCHAGACPPCPKQVVVSCHCGKSPSKPLRCYAKQWSCTEECGKTDECEDHPCEALCHSGDCPPCDKPVLRTCECASPKTISLVCSELTTDNYLSLITCGNVCGKILDCGVHKCDQVCHAIRCEPCHKSCPCGKARMVCTGERERGIGKPCNSTCARVLDCGQHQCELKCHKGSCGSCLELVTKKCRCGAREEEVSCSRDYVCATKCKKIRDCGIHACNKKCCPGDCPPCRNTCGRTLNCKNHKCEMICHRGPCYPCPVSAAVKCFCGQAVRYVPCGSEKKCLPPDCEGECTRPSKCDHPKIQKHKCHHGDCPKCNIVCGKALECGHTCPNVCHTVKNNPKPCFKCVKQVLSKCEIHPNVTVPCHKKDDPCEETCGRPLSCSEHFCNKRCHLKIMETCGTCNEACSKPRPEGCTHGCSLGCHEGRCEDCSLVAKVFCHCETETLLVTCFKQHMLSETDKSCKNQCPKKLQCGHRCLSLCHSGDCPETEKCRRKIKVTCKCKSYKQELECFFLEGAKFLECSTVTCMANSKAANSSGKGKKRTRHGKRNSDSHVSDTFHESEITAEKNTDFSKDVSKGNSGASFPSSLIVVTVIVVLAGLLISLVPKAS